MVSHKKNSRRQNRKNSRKNSRKANARKNTRKQNRRNMQGGNPMKLSLLQGMEFDEIHKNQHGGGAPLMGAPVGYTGMLEDSLRASARVGPIDSSLSEIRGMSDNAMPELDVATPKQSGGSRKNKKASRKNKKASRKNKKASRKNKKASRKNRKMSGGAAPIDASFELLSPAMRMKAGTADFSNPLLLK